MASLATASAQKYIVKDPRNDQLVKAKNTEQLATFMLTYDKRQVNQQEKQSLVDFLKERLNGIDSKGCYFYKSPVSGWSMCARNILKKGQIFLLQNSHSRYAVPFVAAAPTEDDLPTFIDKKLVDQLKGTKNQIATSNVYQRTTIQTSKHISHSHIFEAKKDIHPDHIIAQDYVTPTHQKIRLHPYTCINMEFFDWLRMGVAPGLMTVTGEEVPGIEGKVKTHFIEGLEVKGNTATITYRILKPNTRLDPKQRIIGEVGKTLYAFDRRLHEKFKLVFGSELTDEPRDLQQLFINDNIANKFFPPQIQEQTRSLAK